jgi:nickel/cobalt exporter
MIHVGALLLATATVGILHMSAPDHWATLVILGKASRWTRAKLLSVSLIAGLGHVLLSIIIGLAVVGVGFFFSTIISAYITKAIGALMIAAGLFVGVKTLIFQHQDPTVKPPREDESQDKRTTGEGFKRSAGYFAVLGAALSPDLSVLPIFVLAVPVGIFLAIDIALVFALASILTNLLLVFVASLGLAKTVENLPAKYNDAIAGFVIAAVGLYVFIAG